MEKYENEVIETLYIGGGTPSSLDREDLEKLFEIVKLLNLNSLVEFTFECNLDDINEELLLYLKDNGVNRLSIGIQSFNASKLKFMGRDHSFIEATNAINLARRSGFDNINLDLIYGIPGETLRDLKEDINLFIKLNPEHISTYSLMYEDNTIISLNNYEVVDDVLDAKMYEAIIKMLGKKEYGHYEVSNFSKLGMMSKHNLTYWDNNEYYGFGLGAHGYVHGVRYENTRSLTNYLKRNFVLKQNILSKQEIMENELMLGLRKVEGISLAVFYKKFKVNMQEVFPIELLVRRGDLIFNDGYIKINSRKMYVMNDILIKLL